MLSWPDSNTLQIDPSSYSFHMLCTSLSCNTQAFQALLCMWSIPILFCVCWGLAKFDNVDPCGQQPFLCTRWRCHCHTPTNSFSAFVTPTITLPRLPLIGLWFTHACMYLLRWQRFSDQSGSLSSNSEIQQDRCSCINAVASTSNASPLSDVFTKTVSSIDFFWSALWSSCVDSLRGVLWYGTMWIEWFLCLLSMFSLNYEFISSWLCFTVQANTLSLTTPNIRSVLVPQVISVENILEL